MFVPKVPRRYDFCGRPPCGLCFDWVDPTPPPPPDEPLVVCEPVRVDGVMKMTEDLTGKPRNEITQAEYDQVKGIAEDMHNRALVEILDPPPPEDPGTTFQEAEDEKWFWKNLNIAAEAARVEKAYQEELKKPKSLDQMDWGASEEAKKLVEQESEEKKEELKRKAKEAKEIERKKVTREQQLERERKALEMLRQDYTARWDAYDPYKSR